MSAVHCRTIQLPVRRWSIFRLALLAGVFDSWSQTCTAALHKMRPTVKSKMVICFLTPHNWFVSRSQVSIELCVMHAYHTPKADHRARPRGVYPVDPNLSEVRLQIRFSGVTRCAGRNDCINALWSIRFWYSFVKSQLIGITVEPLWRNSSRIRTKMSHAPYRPTSNVHIDTVSLW